MKCEVCGVDAFISKSEMVVEGDNSPDTKTKIFQRLHFQCRNKECTNFEKEIGTKDIQVY